MIGSLHRFHGYASLRFVYRRGKVVRGPLFSVRAVSNRRNQNYRAAVVVSRKTSKSAVTRNRIRRRIYEIIRQAEGQIDPSQDIVVNVFGDTAADLPPDQLRLQLLKQLHQAGVI